MRQNSHIYVFFPHLSLLSQSQRHYLAHPAIYQKKTVNINGLIPRWKIDITSCVTYSVNCILGAVGGGPDWIWYVNAALAGNASDSFGVEVVFLDYVLQAVACRLAVSPRRCCRIQPSDTIAALIRGVAPAASGIRQTLVDVRRHLAARHRCFCVVAYGEEDDGDGYGSGGTDVKVGHDSII